MTTAEAAAPPDIPVEAALRMLRNAVFERASDTMSQADALHKRIGLLAARVDLLAATATATGDAPNSRAEIAVAARRVEEFRSIDPDVLLELVTALLVADDDPRAIGDVLDLVDRPVDLGRRERRLHGANWSTKWRVATHTHTAPSTWTATSSSGTPAKYCT